MGVCHYLGAAMVLVDKQMVAFSRAKIQILEME